MLVLNKSLGNVHDYWRKPPFQTSIDIILLCRHAKYIFKKYETLPEKRRNRAVEVPPRRFGRKRAGGKKAALTVNDRAAYGV
jgi:hypothetical protein